MFCFHASEDDHKRVYMNNVMSNDLFKLHVPWCIWLARQGYIPSDYMYATLHHWDEFIAFLARKKLQGEFE